MNSYQQRNAGLLYQPCCCTCSVRNGEVLCRMRAWENVAALEDGQRGMEAGQIARELRRMCRLVKETQEQHFKRHPLQSPASDK